MSKCVFCKCAVAGEGNTDLCETCQQLLSDLSNNYSLEQLSTMFVYLLGTKAVDQITQSVNKKLATDYVKSEMRKTGQLSALAQ